MKKLYPDAVTALKGLITDGHTLAVGGFGLCGIPELLINAVADSGVKNLTVISNNAGIDGVGLGRLLGNRQVHRMIASYVGAQGMFEQIALTAELARFLAVRHRRTDTGTRVERRNASAAGAQLLGQTALGRQFDLQFAAQQLTFELLVLADV